MKAKSIILILAGLFSLSLAIAQEPIVEITRDTTWTKADSPITLEGTNEYYSVYIHNDSSPVTLTIEAGVKIIGKRFDFGGWGMTERTTNIIIGKNATLIVKGSSSDPVIFTSEDATKEPHQWGGIIFDEECDASSSSIKHTIFEAGGWDFRSNGAIDIVNGSPTISNCTFDKNGSGIYCRENATPIIQNCEFTNNDKEAIVCIEGGQSISNNTFNNNGSAIDLNTNTPAILENNTFGFNEIIWFPEIINENSTLGIPGTYPDGSNASYRLDDPSEYQLISCEITGAKLTVESGVSIKGNNRIVFWPATRRSTIEVQEGGAIIAEGSADRRIEFTGITNEDNDIEGWGGINFIENVNVGSSSFKYCHFNHANNPIFIEEGCSGTLKVDNCQFRENEFMSEVETGATLDFSNSYFTQAYKGIRSIGGSLKFSNCQIDSVQWGAVYFEHGPILTMDNTIISECNCGVDISETDTEQISPKVTIANSTIHNCSDGIWIGETPLDFTFTNSKISRNGDDGMEINLHKDAKITILNSIFDDCASGLYFPSTDNDEKNPKVSITNSTMQNCEYNGIAIDRTLIDFTFTNGKIINNRDGLNIKLLKDASVNLSGSIIEGNSDNGVEHYQDRESVVMARGNWWGDASGPYDNSDNEDDPTQLYNPDGQGDDVTDWVDYGDWLTFVNKDEPIIMCVDDVPNDQGRFIHLCWSASSLDAPGSVTPIIKYSIWRKVSDSDLCNKSAAINHPYIDVNLIESQAESGWDFISDVTAVPEFTDYYYVAPTLGDSTSSGIYYSSFMVIAHTENVGSYFKSAEQSGYSIDNIAPMAPEYVKSAVMEDYEIQLLWNENTVEDFSHFAVYKGINAEFIPDVSNLVSNTTDTTFSEYLLASDIYYYKVSAFDVNGNESDFASSERLAVSNFELTENESVLYQNYPNPFSKTTNIRYRLNKNTMVKLVILNLEGKILNVLVNDYQKSGMYHFIWNNNQLPSGDYIIQLSTSDKTIVKQCMVK